MAERTPTEEKIELKKRIRIVAQAAKAQASATAAVPKEGAAAS